MEMHPVRRRKKRPNYGVRTVEVTRGKNGFGFTISGQQPCILSCIVSGSPAEKAGLRPGDYLVAVNGQSVSKLLHDDVVRLIGCLNGVLKLQIAENYYSDSSDEENIASIRCKPKFVHKPRSVNANHRSSGFQPNRTAKVVRDLRSTVTRDKFEEATLPSHSGLNCSWDLPELPPPRVINARVSADSKEELSFVIGYLGTIEMPKQIQPGCRPQVVRGCIKRLRTEKRSHSWVLMRVHCDGVTVAGNGGKILAEYPVNRITFCGSSSEEDKKYFGLVTTASGDGNDVLPSSSCHVFAVQSNLFEHEKHSSKASSFKITCTSGTLSQGCFEFPPTSEPILNAIRSFCLTKNEENNRPSNPNELLLANSPQPSHAGSTAASSNSDSGIGFRDDCGNQSDRIVMVDVENQRLHIQQLRNNSKGLENFPNSLNIQLQPPAGNAETCADLQFSRVRPLPVALDPIYGSCSTDQRVSMRPISDSKVPTSNRSRSPLISSSPSSDDDKALLKLAHSKNGTQKVKPSRVSKLYEDEESSKSLPVSALWYEKSIFYQLGLLPNQSHLCGRSKKMDEANYKATSRSSDNLDGYHVQKNDTEDGNGTCNKASSKSTDNLVQMNGSNEFHTKNYRLSPLVNISKCVTSLAGSKLSPLSISYGDGGIIHSTREQKLRMHDEDVSACCDNAGEVLLSYSMNPSLNFGREIFPGGKKNAEEGNFRRNSFIKSADDMSVCSYRSNDVLLSYKLSPKVFGMKRPLMTQSLQDLKESDGNKNFAEQGLNNSKIQQWGSLQDLRSLEPVGLEGSLMMKNSDSDEKDSPEGNRGVAAWASSFEKLLEDPLGLNAFAEFLKKEFSQENITFWVSCEKYKTLEDEAQRKKVAIEIFDTHLSMKATEPVNVDAHARQYAQEKLLEAPINLFNLAQKQIFNLMKFDSYPRFVKSDVYKEWLLLREFEDGEFPCGDEIGLRSKERCSPTRGKLKKSRSDAEDSSRKTILPWNKKNRSKSKDRGETEYKLSTMEQRRENEDGVSVRSEITSSRSSLASWDLALRGSFSRQSITSGETSEKENCQLCRVILSDGATTVVRIRPKETVRELVGRLLEKRGLNYSCFELFATGSAKPLNLDEEASTVSNKEIRVERRIVFRLDLPNRRTVSVKSKSTKNLGQVLSSVLHKYSYRLESVAVCSMSENEVLEMNLPVTAVDGRRLTILTRSTDSWKTENSSGAASASCGKTYVKVPSLDEITNKVFEELLQGKSENGIGRDKSEQGSLKSEEWGSEHSSGIFTKFLRRDSVFHEKTKGKSRGVTSRQILEGATKHVEGVVSMVTGKPPLIGKWKTGSKLTGGKSESDQLYEGLKRAQRNRLEDQRGTEINFELPDFLKDKENAPQSGKKIRKFRREDGANTPKFYDVEPDSQQENAQSNSKGNTRIEKLNHPAKQTEGTKPDLSMASAKKLDYTGKTMSKPLTCKTYETPKSTPVKSDLNNAGLFDGSGNAGNGSNRTPVKNDPPPLPPKPKCIQAKSVAPWNPINLTNSRLPQEITNRGSNFFKPADIKRDSKLARSRKTVYLDQGSSSFV